VLKHELAHFKLDSIFAIVNQDGSRQDSFSVDIDDCPCPKCEDRRGETVIPFSTIEITINSGGREITQRLTTGEAKEVAKWLNEYADFVESLNQDLHDEENPLEEFA